MTDTATSRYKARQQSQGSNTNTWGDDKLNEAFRLYDRGSKGYEAIAMTGDATLSWTNFIATNSGQIANAKLTGSLSSAANLTVPSVEWHWDAFWNTAGQAVTIKTSAGTGIAVPNNRQTQLFNDGTDVFSAAANWLPNYASTLTNAGDVVVKTTLETAIATASLPATSGTVLNSAADTTAGYLGQKIAVAGNLALTTQNGGADEDALITHTPYWATPTVVTTGTTATADKGVYLCRTSTGAITLTLPATGRIQFIDVDGSAATNNITVTPPSGESIMDGSANDTFLADIAWFSAEVTRRTAGTNWSIS